MAINIETAFRIPHLTTAMQGPLLQLEQHIIQQQVHIECWLRKQWCLTPPPITCSVDLRNAGYKIAPVDTNLFPAGFNNLNLDFMPLCIQAMQATVQTVCPDALQAIIIPENHTRNLFYFESLAILQNVMLQAGIDARIGSLSPEITASKKIDLPSGKQITLHPITRTADQIHIGDFTPCFILLNNDLSDGIPEILTGLKQTIRPALELGWSTRLKSQHFSHYETVTQAFGQAINLDPWLINPYFRRCEAVNFATHEGEECTRNHATELLAAIAKKYKEYHIDQKPFLVVKADSGTYGRGVITIDSPEQLQNLNRQQRKEMAMTKGNQAITKVILQEGVYTHETWEDASAEPVVYMIGNHVVGGFYRVHGGRGNDENLNSPGMHFKPLAFAHCGNESNCYGEKSKQNRFYIYGVIARLALLAAAREAHEVGTHDTK